MFLEQILVLEPPKTFKPISISDIPIDVKRNRVARTTQKASKTKVRSAMPELASIYQDGTQSASKRSKRNDDEDHTAPTNLPPIPVKTIVEPVIRAPPPRLYEQMSNILDYFWNLDYAAEVKYAFFARITITNCRDYNLLDFADESCCLPVIQVSSAVFAMES